MAERMIIDGQPATITYDHDLGLFRGEFTELAGSADFYAETWDALATEGRASLKVYLEVCQEQGLSPSKPRPGTLDALLAREEPHIVAGAKRKAEDILKELDDDAHRPQTPSFEKPPGEIVSDEAYQAALKEAASMFDEEPEPDPNTVQGKRFDALISVIEAYEMLHFGFASPITTPDGEVAPLSEDVVSGMLPGELVHEPRDSQHWKQWRDSAVESLPYAVRLLSAAARQRLSSSRPEMWQEIVSICHDALRLSNATKATRGSDPLTSLLETMQSLQEVGAVQKHDMAKFESTIGVNVEDASLEEDAGIAELAFFEARAADIGNLATLTSPSWVRMSPRRLVIGLADGRWISCPLAWFPRLQSASQGQLDNVELSPLGIHWPDVDEDISVSGLLAGFGDMTQGAGLRERFESAGISKIRRCLPRGDKILLLLSDGRCLGLPLAYCTQVAR